MATSSTHSAAPWRSEFLDHIATMESPEFVLGTVAKTQNEPLNAEPRVRTCVFRGTWASLPPNKHNDAPRNSDAYESDCLTFTTDVRMDKAKDFFKSAESDYQGSGGGAPVEAVFWIKGDVQTQWRVRGDVWVLAPDLADGQKKGPKSVKDAVLSRMRAKDGSDIANFDWEKEVTAHFANLSPGMRGSFQNPPPGVPVDDTSDPSDQLIGQLIDDHHDPKSRENFRVVIIRPFRVEATDLRDSRKARRHEYVFNAERGNWQHTVLWP